MAAAELACALERPGRGHLEAALCLPALLVVQRLSHCALDGKCNQVGWTGEVTRAIMPRLEVVMRYTSRAALLVGVVGTSLGAAFRTGA